MLKKFCQVLHLPSIYFDKDLKFQVLKFRPILVRPILSNLHSKELLFEAIDIAFVSYYLPRQVDLNMSMLSKIQSATGE